MSPQALMGPSMSLSSIMKTDLYGGFLRLRHEPRKACFEKWCPGAASNRRPEFILNTSLFIVQGLQMAFTNKNERSIEHIN